MFTTKQIGILDNRIENTLRIFGAKIINGESAPSPEVFWNKLKEQIPFDISIQKPCDVIFFSGDTIWYLVVFMYFEKNFNACGYVWLCKRFDYRVICNHSISFYSNAEIEEVRNEWIKSEGM